MQRPASLLASRRTVETSMRRYILAGAAALALAGLSAPAAAQSALGADIDARAKAIEPKLIAWRRDIHQHP
jgi:amidohydrolase